MGAGYPVGALRGVIQAGTRWVPLLKLFFSSFPRPLVALGRGQGWGLISYYMFRIKGENRHEF